MSEGENGGRAQAFQALRDSEELHRATLTNISDAVFLTDDDGRFTFICPNVDVIFGYVPDEVRAMGRIGGLLGEGLFDPAELTRRGEIRNIERDVTAKGGARRTVLIHLKAVDIKGGTVLCSCRDITELKHAEEELRIARLDLTHASRLALVGELVASIAHEINQPLASIVTNAGAGLLRLERETPSDRVTELRDILGDIRDEGRLAAGVVERLRMLAAKRQLERRALNVNEIAFDTLRLVGGDARRRGVTITTELLPTLPAVEADRVSLQQVMLNLLLNAMDALDQEPEDRRRVTVRTQWVDNWVEVAVSDTGRGIPAERLPRLFDAFFTTKADGLGLGLAIARSIVESHGGRIWAEDHGGRGATFHMTLPPLASA